MDTLKVTDKFMKDFKKVCGKSIEPDEDVVFVSFEAIRVSTNLRNLKRRIIVTPRALYVFDAGSKFTKAPKRRVNLENIEAALIPQDRKNRFILTVSKEDTEGKDLVLETILNRDSIVEAIGIAKDGVLGADPLAVLEMDNRSVDRILENKSKSGKLARNSTLIKQSSKLSQSSVQKNDNFSYNNVSSRNLGTTPAMRMKAIGDSTTNLFTSNNKFEEVDDFEFGTIRCPPAINDLGPVTLLWKRLQRLLSILSIPSLVTPGARDIALKLTEVTGYDGPENAHVAMKAICSVLSDASLCSTLVSEMGIERGCRFLENLEALMGCNDPIVRIWAARSIFHGLPQFASQFTIPDSLYWKYMFSYSLTEAIDSETRKNQNIILSDIFRDSVWNPKLITQFAAQVGIDASSEKSQVDLLNSTRMSTLGLLRRRASSTLGAANRSSSLSRANSQDIAEEGDTDEEDESSSKTGSSSILVRDASSNGESSVFTTGRSKSNGTALTTAENRQSMLGAGSRLSSMGTSRSTSAPPISRSAAKTPYSLGRIMSAFARMWLGRLIDLETSPDPKERSKIQQSDFVLIFQILLGQVPDIEEQDSNLSLSEVKDVDAPFEAFGATIYTPELIVTLAGAIVAINDENTRELALKNFALMFLRNRASQRVALSVPLWQDTLFPIFLRVPKDQTIRTPSQVKSAQLAKHVLSTLVLNSFAHDSATMIDDVVNETMYEVANYAGWTYNSVHFVRDIFSSLLSLILASAEERTCSWRFDPSSREWDGLMRLTNVIFSFVCFRPFPEEEIERETSRLMSGEGLDSTSLKKDGSLPTWLDELPFSPWLIPLPVEKQLENRRTNKYAHFMSPTTSPQYRGNDIGLHLNPVNSECEDLKMVTALTSIWKMCGITGNKEIDILKCKELTNRKTEAEKMKYASFMVQDMHNLTSLFKNVTEDIQKNASKNMSALIKTFLDNQRVTSAANRIVTSTSTSSVASFGLPVFIGRSMVTKLSSGVAPHIHVVKALSSDARALLDAKSADLTKKPVNSLLASVQAQTSDNKNNPMSGSFAARSLPEKAKRTILDEQELIRIGSSRQLVPQHTPIPGGHAGSNNRLAGSNNKLAGSMKETFGSTKSDLIKQAQSSNRKMNGSARSIFQGEEVDDPVAYIRKSLSERASTASSVRNSNASRASRASIVQRNGSTANGASRRRKPSEISKDNNNSINTSLPRVEISDADNSTKRLSSPKTPNEDKPTNPHVYSPHRSFRKIPAGGGGSPGSPNQSKHKSLGDRPSSSPRLRSASSMQRMVPKVGNNFSLAGNDDIARVPSRDVIMKQINRLEEEIKEKPIDNTNDKSSIDAAKLKSGFRRPSLFEHPVVSSSSSSSSGAVAVTTNKPTPMNGPNVEGLGDTNRSLASAPKKHPMMLSNLRPKKEVAVEQLRSDFNDVDAENAPYCCRCLKPCLSSITTIHRFGQVWHDSCFTCSHCQRHIIEEGLYSTTRYLEDMDLMLCSSECRNTVVAISREPGMPPRCVHCLGLFMLDEEVFEACGGHWHLEHFVCVSCGDPFVGNNSDYFQQDGQPWCSGCYKAEFEESHSCMNCGVLVDEVKYPQMIQVENKIWCKPAHFGCTTCGEAFKDNKYFLGGKETQSKLPYCEKHYFEQFVAPCKVCGKLFDAESAESALSINDSVTVHFQCLNCSICKKHLTATEVGVDRKTGDIFCRGCVPNSIELTVCDECGQIMDGEIVTTTIVGSNNETRRYHPKCFKCFHPGCNKLLYDEDYLWLTTDATKNTPKPYCLQHANDLGAL